MALGLENMKSVVRQANRNDIVGMHRVRLSVRENRLVSSAISESSYIPEIEDSGRGWVVEKNGKVVAFAVGNCQTGNIWALFVDPDHERQGYGRRLHDHMVSWLWSQGLERLSLSTAVGTRAQHFYESAGWRDVGRTEKGEIKFELLKS
jgi:GNAT superfamily N-acetyltransferase